MPDTPGTARVLWPTRGSAREGLLWSHLLALFHAGTGFLLELAPWHTTNGLAHRDLVLGTCSINRSLFIWPSCTSRVHAVFACIKQLWISHPQPQPPRKGLTPSWLHQQVTDQLVEGVKPCACPYAWMTPERFAALPAVLCVRELRYRGPRLAFDADGDVGHHAWRSTYIPRMTELYQMAGRDQSAAPQADHGLDVLHCQRLVGVLSSTSLPWSTTGPRVMRATAGHGHGTSMPCDGSVRSPGDTPLVVNPPRPDRVEPRAVKRRPKPYPILTGRNVIP